MRWRIPGLKGARQAARWLKSRRESGIIILGYHQVRETSIDPFDLAVTPSELDQHLAFLARAARPVSLQQAIVELSTGHVAPRTVVVTFDDGYDDTLTTVQPLLRKHGIPATVFVTTGNPGEPFWWDTVAHMIHGAAHMPDHIEVEVDGRKVRWHTNDRARLVQLLGDVLRPLDAEQQALTLSALEAQVGAPSGEVVPRALRAEEIAQLAADPLVEIGAHSVTHPMLATLPSSRQQFEIETCRAALESVTGTSPKSFSYPNGSFDQVTRSLVKESRFVAACCSASDMATRTSEIFALPRFWVDGERRRNFESWFARWARGT